MDEEFDPYGTMPCGCCGCCGCSCEDRLIVCQEDGCYDDGPLNKGQCDSGHPF